MLSQRQKKLSTIGYFGCLLVMGIGNASIGPSIPQFVTQTGSSADQVSILFVTKSIGFVIAALLVGRILDRVPGHHVLNVALLTVAALVVLIPFVPWLWLLAFLMLWWGVLEGTLDVGANALLVWVHREKVGPYMNALHFFFGLGAFLSPILVAQSVKWSDSLFWAFCGFALLAIITWAWLMRLPSPTPEVSHDENPQNQEAGFSILVYFLIFYFLYVGGEVGFGNWINIYALRNGISDEVQASYLNSAFWGALTLGRLVSIPLAKRYPAKKILFGNLIGSLLCLSVMFWWPDPYIGAFLTSIGFGFFMSSIFPTTFALMEERMKLTGKATGYCFVGAAMGGMGLPWLNGQLLEGLGAPWLVYSVAINGVLMLLWFVVLLNKTNRKATA